MHERWDGRGGWIREKFHTWMRPWMRKNKLQLKKKNRKEKRYQGLLNLLSSFKVVSVSQCPSKALDLPHWFHSTPVSW